MISSNKVYMGIDYSMSSPAVCIWDSSTELLFGNCKLFALSPVKKYVGVYGNNITIEINNFPKSDNDARFDRLSAWVTNLHIKYAVTDVYIEGYSMGSKGMVFHIGENTGILKHKLYVDNVGTSVIPPTVIKKYATGKGVANKESMNESFVNETGVDIKNILGQTDKQWNPSSDLIDAYYVLKTGLAENQNTP